MLDQSKPLLHRYTVENRIALTEGVIKQKGCLVIVPTEVEIYPTISFVGPTQSVVIKQTKPVVVLTVVL